MAARCSRARYHVLGGTTPLIAQALVAGSGSPVLPEILLVVAGIVGAVSVYAMRERAGRPMPGPPPTAADPDEARRMSRDDRRE